MTRDVCREGSAWPPSKLELAEYNSLPISKPMFFGGINRPKGSIISDS
jgi:hypothetical protein